MPSISYIANVADFTGNEQEFDISLPISDADVSLLKQHSTPNGGGNGFAALLTDLSKRAQAIILAARPWRCCVCHAQAATRMVATPAYHGNPPGGQPPVIADYTPFPVCPNPQCNHEATRRAHSVKSGVAREVPGFAAAEMDQCANCQVTTAALGSTMMRCAGCRAKLYCSKTCQKEHWKRGHKDVCDWKSKQQRK